MGMTVPVASPAAGRCRVPDCPPELSLPSSGGIAEEVSRFARGATLFLWASAKVPWHLVFGIFVVHHIDIRLTRKKVAAATGLSHGSWSVRHAPSVRAG